MFQRVRLGRARRDPPCRVAAGLALRGSLGRAAVALGSVLLVASACSSDRDSRFERVNVLIVSFDTLRWDHTSLASPANSTTPHLADLARSGIEFVQAYAPASTTGPSHASLFTALYPAWHSVTKNGIPLPERHRTLAERYRDAGYQTAAFVSSYVLSREFGFAQGFEIYEDRFSLGSSTLELEEWEGRRLETPFDRRANATTDLAIEWLENQREVERPFLLFVHYFDPHGPYVPPAEFAARYGADLERVADLEEQIRRYDAEIAFADSQFGRLLDALDRLGLRAGTLVVATADHGEGLMEHGVMEHGAQIYEPLVRIPLVMRLPSGDRPPLRIDDPVSLVDLLPTIERLAAASHPASPETLGSAGGRDLSEGLRGGETSGSTPRPIYFHRRPYVEGRVDDVFVEGERFAVRSGVWKFISAGDGRGPELYDVVADPDETRNRAQEMPTRTRELEERLEAWRSGFPSDEPVTVPPEIKSMLKALGYVD